MNVHLIRVPQAVQLGEWAGLCKLDADGSARKVVKCSCVVVSDYGEESDGLRVLQNFPTATATKRVIAQSSNPRPRRRSLSRRSSE